MNAWTGWALAALAVAMGWNQWGWQGVVLAVTLIVFWLLLQFSRSVRAMSQAAQAPVGHVDSAVMLHAKLRTGMRLLDILPLTRSLGQKVDLEAASSTSTGAAADEVFEWSDASGARVRVVMARGRCAQWSLLRPDENQPA